MRLEWPFGNCSTTTGPASSGAYRSNTRRSAPASSSSPGRAGRVGIEGSHAAPPLRSEQATRPEDAPRHRRLVHLVGAVVDARAALVAEPPGQRRVVGDAQGAVRLDGAVEHPEEDVGHDELDHRDLLARGVGAVPVDAPGGVQHQQPRGVDLRPALGDPLLDDCLEPQRPAGRQLAGDGALAQQVEGALADADPAHAVVDAPGPEPLLGDDEARAALAEQVGRGDADVLVGDLPVGGPAAAGLAHDRDVAHQAEARGVRRDDDLAGAGMTLGCSGSVTAMTIAKAAPSAAVVNHL